MPEAIYDSFVTDGCGENAMTPLHSVEIEPARTVLVTGFGPFPGAPFNPTPAVVEALVRLRRPGLAGARRVGHVFRTSYAAVEAELPALIEKHRPQVVLMFGLAGRTPHIRIETSARNARSALFPDASGARPGRRGIEPGAPPRQRGRAPFTPLVVALRRLGLHTAPSRDAGRYLCNFAYWHGLAGGTPLVLFVHVPKIAAVRRPASGRKAGKRRPLTHSDLVRAGEAVLRMLVAASRR